MAPGYTPYSNYYDPVGSQASQPQGYAYHNPTSSAFQPGTAADHPPPYTGYATGSYGSQNYPPNASAQHTGTLDNGAASDSATGASVGGLIGQDRQQGHARQSSRASNHQSSPVNNPRAPAAYAQPRQPSASVEPMANTTVDPSQVYDFRAEREKNAKAEAEKRRKTEEFEAAKRAGEARIAEKQRQADEAKRQAEEKLANEARRKAEEAGRKADEKAKVAAVAVETRKARESTNAASTLASLASSSNVPGPSDAPPVDDEEAQMRAMFQKMREFNSKNPATLAKLWEEERRSHAAQSQSPQPAKPTNAAPKAPKPKSPPKALKKVSSSNDKSAPITVTPQDRVQSFANPSTSRATPTTPTPQNQPPEAPAQSANANLWPPGKKGLLAEIAAEWLSSTNPQRVVSTTEILDRLDRNPNYVQLCESFETTGLQIDRAAFARELLRSVQQPGINAQPSPKIFDSSLMSANGIIARAAGTASPQAGDPKPKRRRATKAEMEQRRALGLSKGKSSANSNNMVDYEMPTYTTIQDTPRAAQMPLARTTEHMAPSPAHPISSHVQFINNNNSRQPSQSVALEQQSIVNVQQDPPIPVGSAQPTPEVKPESSPRPPANKEEAARKRGFGDLVDLTAEDSDEDVPPKRLMLGPQDQANQRQPLHQRQAGSFGKFPMHRPVAPSPGLPSQAFAVPGMPVTAQQFMPNHGFGMAPPADMGAKSPSAPSNAAVPPIVPSDIPAPPKRKGPSNEHLQAERIRGKMVVEPIMRDRVARRSAYDSRTIARDVLLATGRHPDMRPLNSHLNVMQKMLGDKGGMADTSGNKSDLATIRWDIIDPDPPRKSEQLKDSKTEDLSSSLARFTEIDGEDAVDEQDMSSTQKRGVVGDVGSARQSFPAVDNNKPPPKKRGRPPRASNSNNFISVNMTTPAANSGTRRQPSSQMRGTPTSATAARAPSSSQAPEGAVGYAAFRQLDANGNPIKKKGRPVGWRKSVHSREAQGLTPAKPGTSSATKPKPNIAKKEARLQEPTYQVYKCRWLGCSAELHSLEVLKKHIIKIHGQASAQDTYPCLWQSCRAKSGGEQSATFDHIDDWLAHVDKDHLQPVAWKLGDGPRGGLSGESDADA